MYIETSGSNNGDGVFCSWEKTDLHNISNITFYYNRFSTSNESLRNMGRFRIQILKNNSWETMFTIAQNEGFSESCYRMGIFKFGYYRKKLWYKNDNR